MSNLKISPARSVLLAHLPRQRSFSLLILATATIASLSSCAQSPSPNTASPNASPPSPSALKIVTSTLPVTNFTKAVVGDRASVTYLLPPNVGPHDYQARPEA
jgi:zinc transport system substrate-binding protein